MNIANVVTVSDINGFSLAFQNTFFFFFINLLSANPTKWSNTLKQFVGKLPTNCLSVFDHFVGLALEGLKKQFCNYEKTYKLASISCSRGTFFH